MGEDLVPSLAKTQTEGDSWVTGASLRGRKGGDRYLGAWGAGLDDDDDDDGDEQERGDGMGGLSSEEEDDGELDLARILVHPKRQHSIRSLRKHLHHAISDSAGVSNPHLAGGGAAGRGMNVGRLSYRPIATEEDWDGESRSRVEEAWSGWVRKGVGAGGGGEDDDDDEFVGFPTRGSGRSGSGKSRLGIPAWGNR